MGITFEDGKVAERFNAAVLKTVEGASPPRVRISAFPPTKKHRPCVGVFLLMESEIRTLERRVRRQAKGGRKNAGRICDERRRGADFVKIKPILPLKPTKKHRPCVGVF